MCENTLGTTKLLLAPIGTSLLPGVIWRHLDFKELDFKELDFKELGVLGYLLGILGYLLGVSI